MEASELMIGDWVQDTCGKPIQVRDILDEGINGMWGGGECYDVEAHYDDIEPIPIDEDILVLNGWEGRRDLKMYRYENYVIFKSFWGWNLQSELAMVAEIRFVHELQNILRMIGYQRGFKV